MPHLADLAVLATKHASVAFRGDARASRGGTVNLKCGDSRRARGVAVTAKPDCASPHTKGGTMSTATVHVPQTAGRPVSLFPSPQQQPSPAGLAGRDVAAGRAHGGPCRGGVLLAWQGRADVAAIDALYHRIASASSSSMLRPRARSPGCTHPRI